MLPYVFLSLFFFSPSLSLHFFFPLARPHVHTSAHMTIHRDTVYTAIDKIMCHTKYRGIIVLVYRV